MSPFSTVGCMFMKTQSGIQKERERSIKEDTLNAVHRVRKNKYFTVNDLKKVQKELRRQKELGFKNANSFDNVASNLQKEISHSISNAHVHERRMKRRQDIDRLQVSLREVYEIDNHRYAMEFLMNSDTLEKDFDLDIIFDTHEILMDRLHYERGMFKTEHNYIKGADYNTCSPQDAYMLMKQWVDNINYSIGNAADESEIIDLVCESHIEFERIHPFAGGNGRTSRLLMHHLLLKNEIPLLLTKKMIKRNIFIF